MMNKSEQIESFTPAPLRQMFLANRIVKFYGEKEFTLSDLIDRMSTYDYEVRLIELDTGYLIDFGVVEKTSFDWLQINEQFIDPTPTSPQD